jgi:hypothetical protein
MAKNYDFISFNSSLNIAIVHHGFKSCVNANSQKKKKRTKNTVKNKQHWHCPLLSLLQCQSPIQFTHSYLLICNYICSAPPPLNINGTMSHMFSVACFFTY